MTRDNGRLTCYSCGHSYDFLGAGSHPGVCPDCGEQAVSPAGALDVQAPEPIEIETSLSISTEYRRICGRDASGREFQWWFAVDTGADADDLDEKSADSAQLVRVLIESEAVSTDNVVGTDLVPLDRLRRRLDVDACDPRPVEETYDEFY